MAQPLSGNTLSPSPLIVSGATQYILQATNPGGTVSAFVQINLSPIPVPPPPYNVTLAGQTTNTATIAWQYDTAHIFDIIGFRIYKAPQGSSHFVKVIAETPIVPNGPSLTNTATSWVDTQLPVCGQQYYVVGVYRDTAGNPQETAVGVPSIASAPCPVVFMDLNYFYSRTFWTRSTTLDVMLPSISMARGLVQFPQY